MDAPIDVTTIQIETERLLLRSLSCEDLADIHVICADEEVAHKAGFLKCESLEESEKRLNTYIKDKDTLGIVLKETGTVIGTLSLQSRPWQLYPLAPELMGRELGFDLGKAYWGKGYMPEAVMAVCRYCFCVLGYDYVTAGYFQGNRQSQRAIEKSGFSFLFEDDRKIPDGSIKHITTYIRYASR